MDRIGTQIVNIYFTSVISCVSEKQEETKALSEHKTGIKAWLMLVSLGSYEIVASGDYRLPAYSRQRYLNFETPPPPPSSPHIVYTLLARAAIAAESEVKGTFPRCIRDYQRQTLACVSVAADAHFLWILIVPINRDAATSESCTWYAITNCILCALLCTFEIL